MVQATSAPAPVAQPATGVTAFTPVITKCALGGWLVEIPGRGVAGRTTLEEAINFLEDQAIEVFGEMRPARIPPMFETECKWEVERETWYQRAFVAFGRFLGFRMPRRATA